MSLTDSQQMTDDVARVEQLLAEYPYYTLEAAQLLKRYGHNLDEDTRRRLLHAVALTSSDASTLNMRLNPAADSHAAFYPDEAPSTTTTESAIDKFLNTYGTSSPDEEALLNKLIFNPVPDYSQMLAREEQQSVPQAHEARKGSQDDRINRFILKQKATEGALPSDAPAIDSATVEHRVTDEAPALPADESMLSESLARVFIRQKQYERAFEIINQLNLNFPEKSAYFADQLRFLGKVIANRRMAANADSSQS